MSYHRPEYLRNTPNRVCSNWTATWPYLSQMYTEEQLHERLVLHIVELVAQIHPYFGYCVILGMTQVRNHFL